jgi:hypothetical protein
MNHRTILIIAGVGVMTLFMPPRYAQAQEEATCPCNFLGHAVALGANDLAGCYTAPLFQGTFGSQIDGGYGADSAAHLRKTAAIRKRL